MELKGKRFLVVGLGESGLAMAKWLHRQGAWVRVADSRANPPNLAVLEQAVPGAECVAGSFTPETFAGVDYIALSPGVAMSAVDMAPDSVPVVSEIELFVSGVRRCQPQAKLLAITGSNGKTTTTALTAHLLNSAGVSAVACGNISPSALDALMEALDKGSLPEVWVLELSSFQLESTHHLNAQGATLLNVSEDHLDRHEHLARYAAVKGRIFQGEPVRVLNRDDDYSLCMGGCGQGMVTFGLNPPPKEGHYGIKDGCIFLGHSALISLEALPLKGLHNAANVMAALALCTVVGVDAACALAGIGSFKGLPHRVQPVAEIDGVLYVDDSKGTNVGATLAAIEGMGRPVAIVLGGDGKGQDFVPLKKALQQHGRAVALIGRDAASIAGAIKGCGLPTERFADMASAVQWLARQAESGDCVLLSPACASLDMYKNYGQRAEAFVAAVSALGRNGS